MLYLCRSNRRKPYLVSRSSLGTKEMSKWGLTPADKTPVSNKSDPEIKAESSAKQGKGEGVPPVAAAPVTHHSRV